MEQDMNTDVVPMASEVVSDEKQRGNNGLKIAIVVVSILAACGVGFGAYGMVQNFRKNDQISDLMAQIEGFGDESATSGVGNGDLQATRQNPIISAVAPMRYSIGFTSAIIGYGERGEFSLSLTVRNGEIDSCSINSIESRWAGGADGGMVHDTRFLEDCSVNGVTGKIYKVVEIGEGHDGGGDSVAFILEDGSVDYLPLYKALEDFNFAVAGKLRIEGSVVDAIAVGVSEEGAIGGYRSTVFVLSDGSYVKYDNSMLR